MGIILLALALSFTFAALMLAVECRRAPLWDETEYIAAAQAIRDRGLFGNWRASRRTYLYPLFLSLLPQAGRVAHRAMLGALQWLAWAAASIWMSRTMNRSSSYGRRAVWFAALCNPFVLIYTVEYLTDAISTALVFATLCCAVNVSSSEDHVSARSLLLGVALGAGIMIRPSNVALVLMAFGACVSGRPWPRWARALVFAFLGAMIVLAPQLALNWTRYHAIQPLMVERLGAQQLSWGLAHVKYATAAVPGRSPGVWYSHPFSWWTIPLKSVALVDQDLVFPYNETLHPTYRWPVAILHLPLVGFGILGLAILCAESGSGRPVARLAAAGLLFLVALYSGTAVEARFGLPIVAILYLFAPAGLALAVRAMKGPRLRSASITVAWLCLVGLLFWGARTLTTLMEGSGARLAFRSNLTSRPSVQYAGQSDAPEKIGASD